MQEVASEILWFEFALFQDKFRQYATNVFSIICFSSCSAVALDEVKCKAFPLSRKSDKNEYSLSLSIVVHVLHMKALNFKHILI
jgi:hypothetical protein